jgi:hypothetical protein
MAAVYLACVRNLLATIRRPLRHCECAQSVAPRRAVISRESFVDAPIAHGCAELRFRINSARSTTAIVEKSSACPKSTPTKYRLTDLFLRYLLIDSAPSAFLSARTRQNTSPPTTFFCLTLGFSAPPPCSPRLRVEDHAPRQLQPTYNSSPSAFLCVRTPTKPKPAHHISCLTLGFSAPSPCSPRLRVEDHAPQ